MMLGCSIGFITASMGLGFRHGFRVHGLGSIPVAFSLSLKSPAQARSVLQSLTRCVVFMVDSHWQPSTRGQTCECCIVSARIADCLGIAIATPVAVGSCQPKTRIANHPVGIGALGSIFIL